MLTKRLVIRGFIVYDFAAHFADFIRDMSKWVREGRIKYREDVAVGNEVAGNIDHLEYDADGALTIRAIVTRELARRCNAFSIACSVIDYEIVNADCRDFYGLIKQATLDEVSLTDVPANPQCIVRHRYDVCAQAQFYEHMQQFVGGLSRMVTLLQTTGVRA